MIRERNLECHVLLNENNTPNRKTNLIYNFRFEDLNDHKNKFRTKSVDVHRLGTFFDIIRTPYIYINI